MDHVYSPRKNEEETSFFFDFPSPFLDNISTIPILGNNLGYPNITEPEPDPEPEPANRLKHLKKRSVGKKDRHSKIHTAQGPRDRRMRLSLEIARMFFDLQDLLGFDKASNTIEWLFCKSNKAIKEIAKNFKQNQNQNLHHNHHDISGDVCVTTTATATATATAATTTKLQEQLTSKLKTIKKKRSACKKDRHSKIHSAQGLRDRRMRLSVHTARKFFDLNDMLGFDKASKTIEWLFSKSQKAIKEVTETLQTKENNVNKSPISASCELESEMDIDKHEHMESELWSKVREIESSKDAMIVEFE